MAENEGRPLQSDKMSATNTGHHTFCHGSRDYAFTSDVPEYFVCEICHGVLKECLTTSCCLHSFCTSCLERARGFKDSCPSCRAEHFDTTKDRKTDRLVGSLKVSCRFSAKGCEWQGELSEVEESHIKRNCPYALVRCPLGCDGKVERKDLDAHSVNECPKRPVTCSKCEHESTFEKLHSEHLDDMGQCPMESLSCAYEDFGCMEKVKRCEMDSHNISAVHTHQLMMAQAYRAEMQSMRAEIDTLKTALQEKEVTVEKLKEDVCAVQESVKLIVSSVEDRMDRLTYKKRRDFLNSEEYGEYVSRTVKKGMLVRAVECYESIQEGDVGIFVQSNVLKPPAQFKWLLNGKSYWVFWHQVEILGFPMQ